MRRLRGAGAAVLVLVAGCAHANAPAAAPSAGAASPGATPTPVPVHVTSLGNGSSTTLTEMKHGRKMYTIRAAQFSGDTVNDAGGIGSGTFDAPTITFIDRNGGQTVATAPEAVLTGADKSVLMTGGVRARSQDGNVLHCDTLRYDGRTERVHGAGHVQLRTPSGLTLMGDTLDGDSRLRDVLVRSTK